MVVHPVKVELEGKVEDGSTTSDDAKEGRGFGERQQWTFSDSGDRERDLHQLVVGSFRYVYCTILVIVLARMMMPAEEKRGVSFIGRANK